MAKLTKKQALRDCIILWQYLADSPSVDKKDAVKDVLPNKVYEADCPCCEYDSQHSERCAHKCIVGWPNGNCTDEKSPFLSWLKSEFNITDKTKYALEVIKLAEDALANLEDKN